MPVTKLAFPTLAAAAAACLLMATPVLAQSWDDDDNDHVRPPAGADVARDYLTDEYYDYEGTPPRDPRAREQEGWREGVVRTPPRWAWRRCGCSSLYYGGRWHKRPDLYDYDARVYDERARPSQRSGYEYRWPRNNW